jgi:hypothetical protein
MRLPSEYYDMKWELNFINREYRQKFRSSTFFNSPMLRSLLLGAYQSQRHLEEAVRSSNNYT